jgi:DNA repair protein RadA/Sms
MEHMVDVVLQFEGDRNHRYRILRSTKNRYGSTHEIGLYDMQGEGLKEVTNPSEWLLYEHHAAASGVAVACIMEGNQPLLIETQALVVTNTSAHTHRVGNGIDQKRLSLLLAVIEKQLKIPFFNKDVFVNIAGGFKSEDPALDLAIVSAILSSHFEEPLPRTSCFFGEVGLTGEIRPVSSVMQRITACEKQGFKHIYLSGRNVYKTNTLCLAATTVSAFLSLCFNAQKAPERHL